MNLFPNATKIRGKLIKDYRRHNLWSCDSGDARHCTVQRRRPTVPRRNAHAGSDVKAPLGYFERDSITEIILKIFNFGYCRYFILRSS